MDVDISRIVFWEPAPSHHKEHFFSALCTRQPDLELIYCADHELAQEHRSMGMVSGTRGGFTTIVAPSSDVITGLACERRFETLHVFTGIRWLPTLVRAVREVRDSGARVAIMCEPRDRGGWKGDLRYIQSWLTEGWFRRNARFILAIGANGPPWYRSVGYRADMIVPFAYFIDPPESGSIVRVEPPREATSLRIGYVGRFVETKGVFDLARAVARVDGSPVLALAGAGPGESHLRSICAGLGVDVRFEGVVPNEMIGEFMSSLDVLVLPSPTKDGWGVVVSEALMSGTAVIATPPVGASVMLSEPSFGAVVPARSPESISAAIRRLSESGAFTADARSRRMTLARHRLSADAGAEYLLEILRWSEGGGARPLPFYERTIEGSTCESSTPDSEQ